MPIVVVAIAPPALTPAAKGIAGGGGRFSDYEAGCGVGVADQVAPGCRRHRLVPELVNAIARRPDGLGLTTSTPGRCRRAARYYEQFQATSSIVDRESRRRGRHQRRRPAVDADRRQGAQRHPAAIESAHHGRLRAAGLRRNHAWVPPLQAARGSGDRFRIHLRGRRHAALDRIGSTRSRPAEPLHGAAGRLDDRIHRRERRRAGAADEPRRRRRDGGDCVAGDAARRNHRLHAGAHECAVADPPPDESFGRSRLPTRSAAA